MKKDLKVSEFEFSKAMKEHPLFIGKPSSNQRQSGRRLILKFLSPDHPELDRAEFHERLGARPGHWQVGDEDSNHRVGWNAVQKGFALFVLAYLEDSLSGHGKPFRFYGCRTDSPAAALGNAISQPSNKLHYLLADYSTGHRVSRVTRLLDGGNINGKNKANPNRFIFFKPAELPADCIEIHLDHRLLTQSKQIIELSRRLKKSLGFELPDQPLEPLPAPPPPKVEAATTAQPTKTPEATSSVEQPKTTSAPKAEPSATQAKPDQATEPPSREFPPTIASRIRSELFNIYYHQDDVWEDDQPLIDLGIGDGVGDDTWKIRDASCSLLILGAPGSGKTSGSGFMFGGAFLQAGYGGLVLAAKPDECVRWVRLCDHFDRLDDCILIGEDFKHRINILDYEAQRPGARASVADDVVEFMYVLTELISKSEGRHTRDRFWEEAPRRMMRRLVETFLLAGDRLDIDVMRRFVSFAISATRENLRCNPIGEVLSRAERNQKSDADRIEFRRCLDYWTLDFPRVIPEITRGGIIESFAAMADVLGGRGVRESLCADTTFTPECILSGKIAIVCWPTKGSDKSNLVIQTAWKHLFQKAIERRADKGSKHARPVFLWEDEGHLFFNKYDSEFQATARDCRTAHVILSQNLNNFYQLGHSPHAVDAVFGSIGTHVFHANNDQYTNEWISRRLGQVIRSRRNFSSSSSYGKEADSSHHQTSGGKTEGWEPLVQPQEFERLKMGGDGDCHALVHWLGHSFACNEGRNWRVIEIEQDPINYQKDS